MFEECFIQKVDVKTLSTKYYTTEKEFKNILKGLGFYQIPHNWEKHPEFPEKSNDMSLEDYSKSIYEYYQNINKKQTNSTKKV